jgi:hypothetical protein
MNRLQSEDSITFKLFCGGYFQGFSTDTGNCESGNDSVPPSTIRIGFQRLKLLRHRIDLNGHGA